ncbi:hypothetical protein F5148DRAFT_238892 [Russula earlei]|uniref:Uncharacterized protein n=1 Tax=Russula earlei TaxID=71964 RepID=A0ACC0U4C9_9AGAM|nr:hypothetical protein F5148DRAFT_238892 [Russula earlei]
MQKAAEFAVGRLSADIDYRALSWMFGTLHDDDEFEQFFDALPGVCAPETLVDSQTYLIEPNRKRLSHTLIGMMDRTLLSSLVPDSVKQRRIIIYTKVIDATSLLGPWWTLRRVLLGDWHGFSRFIEFGLFVQEWKHLPHEVTAFYAQYVVAITLSNVQKRDDYWFQLASGHLNASKSLLQSYCTDPYTTLLINAMFIIRRAIQTFAGSADRHRSDILEASSKTLESLCKFDIFSALPEYQYQFCSLWNQLVDAAQNDNHIAPLSVVTLKSIRRVYISLHRGTSAFPTAFSNTTNDVDPVLNEARSYPMCTLHRPSLAIQPLLSPDVTPDTAEMTKVTTGSPTIATASPPETDPSFSGPLVPYQPPTLPSPYFVTPPVLPPTTFVTLMPPQPSAFITPQHSIMITLPTSQAESYIQPPPPTFIPPQPPIHISFSPSQLPNLTPSPYPYFSTAPSIVIQVPPPTPVQSSWVSISPIVPPTSRSPTPSELPIFPPLPSPVLQAFAPSDVTPSPALGSVTMTGETVMQSPSLSADSVSPVVIKFNGYGPGEYSGLMDHSSHTVVYEDEVYPTALHLFEACKFLDHRPDLADHIRQCERVEQVAATSAELAEFTRRDWGNVALSIVSFRLCCGRRPFLYLAAN